jgi:hypothetical protein
MEQAERYFERAGETAAQRRQRYAHLTDAEYARMLSRVYESIFPEGDE